MNQRILAEQLEITDITDRLIVLRDGSYAMVLEATSINLDLKSEAEADVLITHYQHLLQSLAAPVQIMIKTRAVDMEEQYEKIKQRIDASVNPTQKKLLEDYKEFLSQLVMGRNMLTRKFYLVISCKSKEGIEPAAEQLQTQKEQLVRLLQPMEIKAHQLENIALANLFYSSFQPGKSKLQPLVAELWS